VLSIPTTQAQYLVYSLRQRGFNVMTEMVSPNDEGGRQYAKWHLLSEPTSTEQMELAYE